MQALPRPVKKLTPLDTSLQSLAASTSTTLETIQAGGSDLKEGFDKAGSCEQFR
jgi:hypothetical protein